MQLNLVLDCDFSDESDTEPVTVTEAKNYMRVDVTDDDTLIGELITAARQQLEKYLNISLIERTVIATLENGLGNIRLPYCPFVELTSVKDEDDNDITDYTLHGSTFKWICTPSNCRFISEYTAGYAAEDLPKYFKTGILKQVSNLYENRGDAEQSEQLAPDVIKLLKPHRRVIA